MRFAIGLGLIVIAAVTLTTLPDGQTIAGLERERVGAIVVSFACLIMVSGWTGNLYRGRLGQALKAMIAWLLIVLALVAGYSYRSELEIAGRRILGSIVPGIAIGGRDGEVVVTRIGNGTFPIIGDVNGYSTRFIFDTGASSVVIRFEEAARLGIGVAGLNFSVRVSTANGTTLAAPVTLTSLNVGSIHIAQVKALVAQRDTLSENLLGHSFLSRLSSYTVAGDRLILRGPVR